MLHGSHVRVLVSNICHDRRLVALSILPIEQSTLAYGSADGGVVVHTEHSQLNDYMAAAGQKLNLKVPPFATFRAAGLPE